MHVLVDCSSSCLALSGVLCVRALACRALQPYTGSHRAQACLLIPYLPAAQYEPELFPGLIYRMKEPKVVLLIFVSGKVVLTGAPAHLAATQGRSLTGVV